MEVIHILTSLVSFIASTVWSIIQTNNGKPLNTYQIAVATAIATAIYLIRELTVLGEKYAGANPVAKAEIQTLANNLTNDLNNEARNLGVQVPTINYIEVGAKPYAVSTLPVASQ